MTMTRKEQELYENLTVEINGLKQEIDMMRVLLREIVEKTTTAIDDLRDAVKALQEAK